MIHVLLLCLVGGCALWVLVGIQRLRATVEVKKNNLHDFLVLSQGVTSSKSRDPMTTASRLGELLASRSWEGTFDGLKPKIVMTASGPLLRLVSRNLGSRRQDSRQDSKQGNKQDSKQGNKQGSKQGSKQNSKQDSRQSKRGTDQ